MIVVRLFIAIFINTLMNIISAKVSFICNHMYFKMQVTIFLKFMLRLKIS